MDFHTDNHSAGSTNETHLLSNAEMDIDKNYDNKQRCRPSAGMTCGRPPGYAHCAILTFT